MEHIQSRAKEQLLNIDDDIFQEVDDYLFVSLPENKQKAKKNIVIKNLASNTPHERHITIDKQNSKQTLKKNLRELLQTEIVSPKTSLHRVSTLTSIRTVNHSKTISKIPNLCYNEKTSRVSDFQKLPLFSLLRQNQSCMNKRMTPVDSFDLGKKNVFEQQNSQIRKFIKRKMQQKALQKQKRILPLTNTIENVKKFQTLIYQKNKLQQNNEEKQLVKQNRSNIQRASTKILKQKITEKQKIYDKENNFIGLLLIPSIKRQNQIGFQSRKLRNILF